MRIKTSIRQTRVWTKFWCRYIQERMYVCKHSKLFNCASSWRYRKMVKFKVLIFWKFGNIFLWFLTYPVATEVRSPNKYALWAPVGFALPSWRCILFLVLFATVLTGRLNSLSVSVIYVRHQRQVTQELGIKVSVTRSLAIANELCDCCIILITVLN